MDGDEEKGYRWETEYERTWEALRETEGGLLQPTVDELVRKARRGQHALRKNVVRLGMMRHVYVVLDMSECMLDMDLKPARINVTLKLLENFFNQFFDQNPISQVGLISTSIKRANKVVELNGNAKTLLNGLKTLSPADCAGEPSLQNSLETSLQTLKNLPKHTSKEVVIIMGSLTSCDPSDINTTIDSLLKYNVRVSIIGLAAEISICKKIARLTKGSYHVILDEHHYKDLLNQHLCPPPASETTESSLIRMGFPRPHSEADGLPSLCVCHMDSNPNFSRSGYFCPQCNSKYCDLPVECGVCGLTLVSAAHLARSYHHLFPVEVFHEETTDGQCFSCTTSLSTAYRCGNCSKLFCHECDNFIHESLHVCPGCAAKPNYENDMEI